MNPHQLNLASVQQIARELGSIYTWIRVPTTYQNKQLYCSSVFYVAFPNTHQQIRAYQHESATCVTKSNKSSPFRSPLNAARFYKSKHLEHSQWISRRWGLFLRLVRHGWRKGPSARFNCKGLIRSRCPSSV